MKRSGAAFQDNRDGSAVKGFRGSFSGYERNAMFLKGTRFVEAAHGLGLAFDHDGRSVAPFDMDGDGDLDLAVLSLQGLQLLENTSPARSWVRFRLTATASESHALGAQVTIEAGGRTQIERVRLTVGFQTQVSRDIHFGLADADQVDRIEVRWPSGKTQRFAGLGTHTRWALVEGLPAATELKVPTWPEDARPRGSQAYRLDVPLQTLDGEQTKLEAFSGPTVLNFWAPWCEACKREIPALAKLARERGDVRVVAVSVETSKLDDVRAFAAKHGVMAPAPLFGVTPVYLATDPAVKAFFGPEGRMTLPATFIFDAQGQLRRSHFREVNRADLDAALNTLRAPASARDFAELAALSAKAGNPKRALELLARAVELDPKSGRIRWQLGMASLQTGLHDAGVAALTEATRMSPDDDGFVGDLAGAWRTKGKNERALKLLQDANKRWPESFRIWGDLAALNAQLGRFETARKAFREALRRYPMQARMWKDLAELEGMMGRHDDSAASHNRYRALIGELDFNGGE